MPPSKATRENRRKHQNEPKRTADWASETETATKRGLTQSNATKRGQNSPAMASVPKNRPCALQNQGYERVESRRALKWDSEVTINRDFDGCETPFFTTLACESYITCFFQFGSHETWIWAFATSASLALSNPERAGDQGRRIKGAPRACPVSRAARYPRDTSSISRLSSQPRSPHP